MADRYDIDRDRERERYDRDRFGERDFDRERRERERWAEGRHEWGREGNLGEGRRDWGREGSWGEGRRDWEREGRFSEGRREPYWGEGGREWGRERGREDWYDPRHRREGEERRYTGRDWGREGTWGGPRDFMQGSDFNRQSYYGTGAGGYGTTWGGYTGGSSTYSGGMGSYGERGRYAGRGPKAWQRSDDRIREDVNMRLTDHPDVDATEVEVQVRSSEVTLTGTVDDRDMKRIAEDIAENVSGVKQVHNQLRVAPHEVAVTGQRQGSASGTGGTATR